MSSLLLILLSAVLVCHFGPALLGGRVFVETDEFRNAVGLALASSILIAVAAIVSHLIDRHVLAPFDLVHLRLFIMMMIVMTLAQLLTLMLPRWGWTPVRPAFPILMSMHTAVIGVAWLSVRTQNLSGAIGAGVGIGLAFALLLLAFTTLQQRTMQAPLPAIFRGAPIAMINAGLMALALMGLTGLIRD
jgi:electron transport complex protein RnfA